jgi:8-oxo-dGTP pyrophosphatase MutT (NUDIX family)
MHTKAFYPGGVLRLPSGGIKTGEPILAAAEREVQEETGLALRPLRFLFHVIQHLDLGDEIRPFHTLALLFPESAEPVAPTDPGEEITELRDLRWDEMPDAIRALEELDGGWAAWGRFRALPHRMLLELRAERPGWFAAGG